MTASVPGRLGGGAPGTDGIFSHALFVISPNFQLRRGVALGLVPQPCGPGPCILVSLKCACIPLGLWKMDGERFE